MKHVLAGERGSMTLWTLVLFVFIMTAGFLAMTVGQVLLTRQHLSMAADMSALAAADLSGPGCSAASAIAADNRTELTKCWTDGLDYWVEVSVPAPSLLKRMAALTGQAAPPLIMVSRAGPELPDVTP
ncbi:MAG: hypothetical protein RJB01_1387 [Actinomycetota bacterium]